LIVPPQEGRDDLEAANAKLLREHDFTLNEEAWVRERNRQTVDDSFAYLDHEVVSRETPEGPEVLGRSAMRRSSP
jgi:endo-alpha-1,4-polygalactosaminidase (GH114 family)